jgi:hypothetical protein
MRFPSFPLRTLSVAALAAVVLAGLGRADDTPPTAPAGPPGLPPQQTPTRTTPVSSSQTSATPVNGPGPETNAPGITGLVRPAWLTDLSFGFKESYDDNFLRLSGQGMPVEGSFVELASFKLGVDLVPLLGAGPLQTFSLVYQPDRAIYSQAESENFTAHRFNTVVKGRSGDLSFSVDNAFLYNDGNRLAETYALNQLSGAAANQNDKYRNSLAHAPARERRNQIQDRYTVFLQYDTPYLFFRPISQMNDLDMRTYLFNTSKAPYLGYQDYPSRYDINAGADLGFKVAPGWALTVGYRDGYQKQDQFALAINSDQHFSSNHYQRLLFGVEGKLSWLNLRLAAGPDFRDFNPETPIDHLRTTRFFGEASATATLSPGQTLTFAYRDYVFVSSTGLVPYEEYSYSLTYHRSFAKEFGFDLGGKAFEHNYTISNDTAGSAPSLRRDYAYEGTIGLPYSITPHLVATLGYSYDIGRNGLDDLPAKYAPYFRDFQEGVGSLSLQYKF